MAKLDARNQINGSFGSLYWNGELILEVEFFEAKVTANREDVQMAGTLDVDSKITSLKGEGSFKIKKIFTRGINKMLDEWKKGKDPRSQLVGKLADPDSPKKQKERVIINNVAFSEITLMQFELGQKLESEFPFTFTPSDVEFPDVINN
jgi:hypothetical protein